MPQIFVSHSKQDEDSIAFLSKAAAGSSVRLVFVEFEKEIAGGANSKSIAEQIDNSAAVFIALSPQVQNTLHTRDWVAWEAGCAKDKDIWVLEWADRQPTSVVIPSFRHYVVYHNSLPWQTYLRRVIDSYSTLETAASATVGGVLGALGGPVGIGLGVVAGVVLSSPSRNRPLGREFRCPRCGHMASAHYPEGLTAFRCACCNETLCWPAQSQQVGQ